MLLFCTNFLKAGFISIIVHVTWNEIFVVLILSFLMENFVYKAFKLHFGMISRKIRLKNLKKRVWFTKKYGPIKQMK